MISKQTLSKIILVYRTEVLKPKRALQKIHIILMIYLWLERIGPDDLSKSTGFSTLTPCGKVLQPGWTDTGLTGLCYFSPVLKLWHIKQVDT